MATANDEIGWSTSSTGTTFTVAAGDLSNAALYSEPFRLTNMEGYSIQLVTTGATVTGAFKLQASNDKSRFPEFTTDIPTNWTDVDGSSTSVTVAGSVMWNANGAYYNWVRVVWTESGAAAGNVTGRYVGKTGNR